MECDLSPDAYIVGAAAGNRKRKPMMTNAALPIEGRTTEVKRIVDLARCPLGRAAGTDEFAGHRTLHRVTRVGGTRHRLLAVQCCNREPGAANSDEVRKLFRGRAA